jgi:hypothetical protein
MRVIMIEEMKEKSIEGIEPENKLSLLVRSK